MDRTNWMEIKVEVNETVYRVRTESPLDICYLRLEVLDLIDELCAIILEMEGCQDEHRSRLDETQKNN